MNKIILIAFLIALVSCTSKTENKEVAPPKVVEQKGDLLCDCMMLLPTEVTEQCLSFGDSINNAFQYMSDEEKIAFDKKMEARMETCDKIYFNQLMNDDEGLTICECYNADMLQRLHGDLKIECDLLESKLTDNEIASQLQNCDKFVKEQTRLAEEKNNPITVCECMDHIYLKTMTNEIKIKCDKLGSQMDSLTILNEAMKCESYLKMIEGDSLK